MSKKKEVCVQVVLPASVKGALKFNAVLQTSEHNYDLRIVREVLGEGGKKGITMRRVLGGSKVIKKIIREE